MADRPTFALYVSSVEGHLVTRLGAGGPGAPTFIGARRSAGDPTEVIWTPELVVALTAEEVGRYRREYERALEAKALKPRTEKEYLAQLEREAAAVKAATPPAAALSAPSVGPESPPAASSPKP